MKVNFGGTEETVVTRGEFPLDKARDVLKDTTIAVLGYGSQGPGQSQNLRDNGFNVIVGQRQGTPTWDKAIADKWKPGETLFSLEEAAQRGDIISFLLSDASQPVVWPGIQQDVDGKTLYVSHGFPVHFKDVTGIVPSPTTDVIMVAPKGAGLSVRRNFLNGSGINASYAVHQDASGSALEKTLAMGIGIGAGYLFETTCEREVVSDHVGERAVLLGGIWALAEAAYDSIRRRESPNDSFILSSEQLTQVILPLIGKNGAAEIYDQALKAGELATVLTYQERVRTALQPKMERLYESCRSGTEARIALTSNSHPDYRVRLEEELAEIDNSEMWSTGKRVRDTKYPREYAGKVSNFALAGAVLGAMEAQYQTLINHGHTPSEAGNETVEEATESLNQFYQAKGVSHLLGVCSTTAQRGSLDWGPRLKSAILPVFMEGKESYGQARGIPSNYTVTVPNMWQVMETVRELRPGNK